MSGITISVAMCTYNGARFLSQQLESIAAQTRPPNELVISDDHSFDESANIVRAFARQASFPVHFETNKQNIGATRNFEGTIQRCCGEVIALSDQDDVWNASKLEQIAEAFARSQETVAVFSDGELIDDQSNVLPVRLWQSFLFSRKEQGLFAKGRGFNVLLKHPVVTGATLAFRSRFRGLIVPIPPNHAHDYWIAILLAACGHIQVMPETIIKYRRHERQQIGAGPAALSIAHQTATAIKTGRTEYLSEIAGLQQVSERLKLRSSEFGCRNSAVEAIAEKVAHRSARAMIPPSRLLRIPTVLREVANRRYWRYSEGWKSIGKDILLTRVDGPQ